MTHIEWNAKHLVCIILPLFIIMQQSVGMCEFVRKAHVNDIMNPVNIYRHVIGML